MPYYRTCPECGQNLDPGERCDCQDKKEDAPAATEAPSRTYENTTPDIVADRPQNVNDSLRLREICESTGAMGKDIAMVVRESFPKFNRQLLAQCQAPEKYGIVIHPEGLRVICETYGVGTVELPEVPAEEPEATAPPPKKTEEKRKLPRKLTFRMTARDYARLIVRVDKDGFDSVQAWLYDKIIKLLEGEADV